MDEDPFGPCCSCRSGMDDSRLSVCLAGSLCRYRPASCSAPFSYDLVVLGYGHPAHRFGGPEDPRIQQTICSASSGPSGSEPAADVWVRVSFGDGSGRVRAAGMEWLGQHQVTCRCAARIVSLELAHLLADRGSLASLSLLPLLYCG